MPDYGATVADKAIRGIDRKLQQTYKIAREELEEKLKDFEKRHAARDAMMRQRVQDGKMSQQEYQDWLAGQVFIRGQWQDKIRQVSAVLTDHDQQAAKIINERKLDVFAENYNHEAYVAEKTLGISFGIYNTQAVAKLIQEDPQILPEWEIDKPKEYEWCYKKVNNIVKQGIIQGEGIPQITARLCRDLAAQSKDRMRLFARTAITGAQNAGRQQQMEDAAGMGIEIRKQWLATLDSRTRDAHRRLDGQEVPYDEPFKIDGQEINYPGDPTAHPALVYNCRCTVVSVYPKYEGRTQRGWREDEEIDGQSYLEWKNAKQKQSEEAKQFDRAATIKQIVTLLNENCFNGAVTEEYKNAIINSLQNADEKMLQIVQKTIGNVYVQWEEENPHKVSHYMEGTGSITIVTKASGERRTSDDILRTFWHEYGHFVDDAAKSGSGYGYKSEYGDYFFDGIKAEILKDDKWMYAAMEDTNMLLKYAGLDDRYECKFESGMYTAGIFKKDGQYVDARNPDFDTMNELEDGLSKWVKAFSKHVSLDDYKRKFGYPERPDRDNYIEVYYTPKRHLYRERELFKDARDAYNQAIRAYYDKADAFEKTHDMEKIYEAWAEMEREAKKREDAVAPATDTFDGGVGGAFFAFILHGGHEPKYYAVNRMGANEGVANVFSALMTKNRYQLDAFSGLCPNIFNLIQGVILK